MSSLVEHAQTELALCGYNPATQEEDPDKWVAQNVLALVRLFASQGHSGSSAPYCLEMFQKLASFQPLKPLMGTDDEWQDVSQYGPKGSILFQNKRCSRVFKNGAGETWDCEGQRVRTADGSYRSGSVAITFPYTPKTEWVEEIK